MSNRRIHLGVDKVEEAVERGVPQSNHERDGFPQTKKRSEMVLHGVQSLPNRLVPPIHAGQYVVSGTVASLIYKRVQRHFHPMQDGRQVSEKAWHLQEGEKAPISKGERSILEMHSETELASSCLGQDTRII